MISTSIVWPSRKQEASIQLEVAVTWALSSNASLGRESVSRYGYLVLRELRGKSTFLLFADICETMPSDKILPNITDFDGLYENFVLACSAVSF